MSRLKGIYPVMDFIDDKYQVSICYGFLPPPLGKNPSRRLIVAKGYILNNMQLLYS